MCVKIYRSARLDVCELCCVCVSRPVSQPTWLCIVVSVCWQLVYSWVSWLMVSGFQWESLLVAAHSSPWRLPGPAGVTGLKLFTPAAGDEGQRGDRVFSL